MICYKDRIFCPFIKCKNKKCNRRLTKKIIKDAEKTNLLISQYAIKPECFE